MNPPSSGRLEESDHASCLAGKRRAGGAGARLALGEEHDRREPRNDRTAQYTTDASRFVEVEGACVHYRDDGPGPPLMFLHGTFASQHAWDGRVAELRDSYRCIRVDQPGFGLTCPWPRNYTIDSCASFVETFAVTLDLDSFAVVGTRSAEPWRCTTPSISTA